MSVSKLPGEGFDFTQLNKASNSDQSKSGESGTGSSAAAADSFALQLAEFRSQALGSLINTAFGGNSGDTSTNLASLQASLNASTDPLSALTSSSSISGLSAAGRNTSLRDPESAYKMMTTINNDDVTYKAQFSELSQMKSSVSAMQQDGQGLEGISSSTSNDSIKSQLQEFANQYNAWVQRFDADVKDGGLLANTQAAQVSRFELEQNIENVFNGAKDGLHGLSNLGLSIDPTTKLASLDTAQLDSVLATNKQGVVDAVQQFSENFVKSATLLNAKGNFIPNQLNNLSRAIAYIADNKTALQAEFGTGDAAKPSDQVAQALAAYKKVFGS